MKKNKVFSEFKEFIMRGNIIDLSVGIIIGGAFQKIVTSLVNDVFMPLVSLVTKAIMPGGLAFTDWFLALDGKHYDTFAQAKAAGAITINYGTMLSNVLDFLIMAAVIFAVVKMLNKLADIRKKEEAAPEVTEKTCPYCQSKIPLAATRCPQCTSQLEVEMEIEEVLS